ncbi:hypothetical protein RHDE110596_10880 [Prescottella defluvii]|uniref:hypothetical protein n=1 Tax=Prescottella defluvii TaxID=1323361 RepID=UPI0004F25ED5|nr:hypothetical protein [Prescottella defluvii]
MDNAGHESDFTGRLTFRTVYGGPDIPGEWIAAVTRVKRRLGVLRFAYDLDVLLHVGGSISSTDGPPGLRHPRVSVAKRSMTAQIHIGRADVRTASDPDAFVRETITRAVRQMIERIAAKDRGVDAATEDSKLGIVFEAEEA